MQIGTENIERLTKMMNDVFDILNLRFCKEGIVHATWENKKGKLNQMLQALSETERVFEEHGKNVKMFVSETSLQAWRLTINSAINLIEEQFKAGIKVVLTGKFNQDPLERLTMFSIFKAM